MSRDAQEQNFSNVSAFSDFCEFLKEKKKQFQFSFPTIAKSQNMCVHVFENL